MVYSIRRTSRIFREQGSNREKKGTPRQFIGDTTFEHLFQIGGNAAGGLLIQSHWTSMILVAFSYQGRGRKMGDRRRKLKYESNICIRSPADMV